MTKQSPIKDNYHTKAALQVFLRNFEAYLTVVLHLKQSKICNILRKNDHSFQVPNVQ